MVNSGYLNLIVLCFTAFCFYHQMSDKCYSTDVTIGLFSSKTISTSVISGIISGHKGVTYTTEYAFRAFTITGFMQACLMPKMKRLALKTKKLRPFK